MRSSKKMQEIENAIDYKRRFMNKFLDENKKKKAWETKHEVQDLQEEIDSLKRAWQREKFINDKALSSKLGTYKTSNKRFRR
tara:strand:- start:30 stop:275 length:246 start_codon:yes stop_codon:yes gene_type:complete